MPAVSRILLLSRVDLKTSASQVFGLTASAGGSGTRGKCQSLQETMSLRQLLTHRGASGNVSGSMESEKVFKNVVWPLPL